MEQIVPMKPSEVVSEIFSRMGDKSLRQYALELGVSAMYLSDVANGKREPGKKLLKPLGIRKVRSTTVHYEKILNVNGKPRRGMKAGK